MGRLAYARNNLKCLEVRMGGTNAKCPHIRIEGNKVGRVLDTRYEIYLVRSNVKCAEDKVCGM
jgi:hypothetical protein